MCDEEDADGDRIEEYTQQNRTDYASSSKQFQEQDALLADSERYQPPLLSGTQRNLASRVSRSKSREANGDQFDSEYLRQIESMDNFINASIEDARHSSDQKRERQQEHVKERQQEHVKERQQAPRSRPEDEEAAQSQGGKKKQTAAQASSNAPR